MMNIGDLLMRSNSVLHDASILHEPTNEGHSLYFAAATAAAARFNFVKLLSVTLYKLPAEKVTQKYWQVIRNSRKILRRRIYIAPT
jgi:hypothetical protein